jgi:hypothetical protein
LKGVFEKMEVAAGEAAALSEVDVAVPKGLAGAGVPKLKPVDAGAGEKALVGAVSLPGALSALLEENRKPDVGAGCEVAAAASFDAFPKGFIGVFVEKLKPVVAGF